MDRDAEASADGTPETSRHRPRANRLVARQAFAVRRALAGELISLAGLLGRPVLDLSGSKVGKVRDVAVRPAAKDHPPVVSVLASFGKGHALLAAGEVTLTQSAVHLNVADYVLSDPAWPSGVLALAQNVLDHQVIDVRGIEVVRAADVYLVRFGDVWELAGVDVGPWSLVRRLLPRTRGCPPPERLIDWTDLHAFASEGRGPDGGARAKCGPFAAGAAGPGDPGGDNASTAATRVQLSSPAAKLHTLKARDVAALLGELGRHQQAALTAALGQSSTVVDALRQLEPAQLEALLGELDQHDQARLRALLDGSGT